MNVQALYHNPQSEYAYNIAENKSVIRFRSALNDLVSVQLAVKYKYNEKPIGVVAMKKRFSDDLFDYYECELDTDRGRRLYYFILHGAGGETLYYTENGAEEPQEIMNAYFPHFQIPFVSDSDIVRVPHKFENVVLYQIFPDRFYTENPKCDFSAKPEPMSFFGGELYGAAKKLEYLKELGINCVYLTPINPSRTNHHYDVEDYYDVAQDLGGSAAFKAFVKQAHALGIKVILDGVFNHCSYNNPIFQDVVKNGRASKYYDWFLIDGDNPDFKACNYKTFAQNVAYMPKLNCDNREVQNYCADVAVHWIKTYGIDAWRLDVGDDVSPELWRVVRRAIKAVDPDAIMIGEDWMNPHAFVRGDVFDSVMNYGFTRVMRDFFAYKKIDAKKAAARLIRTYLRTTAPTAKMMMNFLDCHDTHRFLFLCNENMLDYTAALCTMFFYDGMPMLFYGDELPMTGGADPDCRRGFDWAAANSPLSELISALSGMRTAESPDTEMYIREQNGALIIERKSGAATTSAFAVNTTDNAVDTDLGRLPQRSIALNINGTKIITETDIAKGKFY